MKHSDWHEKPQRKRGTTVKQLVKRSFAAAAALVVFATTYAMILPAVTASVPTCGIEEHTHTEACYRTEKRLICDNTDENHAHTEECYTEQQVLVCGLEAHTHTDECYEAPTTEPEAPKEKALSAAVGSQPAENAVEEYTDFEKYLTAQGGSIVSYLKKGGSIVSIPEASGDGYTYQIKISSPSILSGTYYYPLPKGMTVDVQSKSGEVSNGGNGGKVIGTYKIITDDSSSYILFTFGKDAEQYQTISGRIEMAVSFAEAMEPAVSKDGWLVSPDGAFDGFFHFKITAQIPAAREGAAKREWRIEDYSRITHEWRYDFSDPVNDANMNMSITYLNAESGEEETYAVKNLSEVSKDLSQTIAYYADSKSGYLYLVNRCQCEDSALCPEEKDGKCDCELLSEYPGWCTCWSLTENAAVVIEYKNAVDGYDGSYILSDQNTLKNGGEYENRVALTGTYKDSNGKKVPTTKKATAVVNYKAMLEKQEIARGEGDEEYIKTFRITVNKPFAVEHADERADFSLYDGDGDGKPDGQVVLTDSMTNLKYILGSMKITAENGDESIALVAGTDFTVEATQTDNGTDLKITLLKLGKYEYQIEYSAQVFADSSQETVTIGNKAQVDLGTEGSPSYQLTKLISFEDEWNFERYETTVCKVDYDNQALKLEGAVFALFAGDGTKMAEQTTGEDGNALFQTNSKTGLIYRTDTLYYIQETQAPEGYGINTAKYWFYFSKQKNTELEEDFAARYPGSILTHVSLNEESMYAAKLTVTDERLYELPETGGSGTAWFYLTGGVLTALAAIVIVITFKRRYDY